MHETTLSFKPSLNLFFGKNGSGKTSLLEAIYFLSFGRSFRSRLNKHIIHHDQPFLSLIGNIAHGEQQALIGMERHRDNALNRTHLNAEKLSSLIQLANIFPVQVINSEGMKLLNAGPKLRRQFLDWGVFHVEHRFISAWQDAQQALKQRNAALKSQECREQITSWDHILVQRSNELNEWRNEYADRLSKKLDDLLPTLCPFASTISLKYRRGWNKEKNLQDVLADGLARDQAFGYTQYGPHRATLELYANGTPAQHVLSQGQQKLVVCALRLAQGLIIKELAGKRSSYLVDDLPSELDTAACTNIARALANTGAQVFITGIAELDLSLLAQLFDDAAMFHVEHGHINVSRGT